MADRKARVVRRQQLFHARILKSVAEPNRAAIEHLAANQGHRADRRCRAGHFLAGVEDMRSAFRTINCRADRQTNLIDETCPQKGAVGFAAAFEQQTLDLELEV